MSYKLYNYLTSIVRFFFLIVLFYSFTSQSQMAPHAMPPINAQDIDTLLSTMSEKEFNDILEQLSKMSPEELEELEKIGRQVLLESGIDPDTGKPLEQKTAPAEVPPLPSVETAKSTETRGIETRQLKKVQNVTNVQTVLDSIKNNIDSLRQKAHENSALARRLLQWNEALTDLVFYIKVIDKKEHRERLASTDFVELFNVLETLAQKLQSTQPSIIISSKNSQNDPYIILGVTYDATPEEITAHYTKLKNKYSTKKIKNNLKKQNASSKEIAREVRAAELTLSLINDAYDQLRDPKTKSSIDEKRRLQKNDELTASSLSHLTQTLEAISNSIYQQKLLTQLQDFLKKYEPEQLAQKQALDAAQAQRHKEQKEFEKSKPILNTTQNYDKKYPSSLKTPPSPRYNNYYDGYYPSYSGNYDNYASPVSTAGNRASQPPKSNQGNEKSPVSSKAPENKDKDKDDALKKQVDEMNKKKTEDKKKQDEKKLTDLEKELKELKNASKTAGSSPDRTPTKGPQATPVTAEQLFNEIADIRISFMDLQKAANMQDIQLLIAQTAAGNPMLSEDELVKLVSSLPLAPLLMQLNQLETDIQSVPKTTLASLKKAWGSIALDFRDLLYALKNNSDTELKKYTDYSAPLPMQLVLLQNTLRDIIELYNTLSVKII